MVKPSPAAWFASDPSWPHSPCGNSPPKRRSRRQRVSLQLFFEVATARAEHTMPIAHRLARLTSPVRSPTTCMRRLFDRIPRITLETVFLDDELRVSRLPDGNFLIYVRDY